MLKKNISKKIIVLLSTLLLIICSLVLSFSFATGNIAKAEVVAPQATWKKMVTKNVTYKGQDYRVTLYKDVDFQEKQVLFTSTPVYHNGNKVDYTVTITENSSTEISESVGVTVSSDVKAFGNGVKASLGVTAKIAQSYTVSASDSHSMNLDENDKNGYWAVYGYNTYTRYKIDVEKVNKRKVETSRTPKYGYVKEGKNTVYKVVGYDIKYKTETYYTYESKYSGEFLTSTYEPDKFIFDFIYLG